MAENENGEFVERNLGNEDSEELRPGEDYTTMRERILNRRPDGVAPNPPGASPGRMTTRPTRGRFFTKREAPARGGLPGMRTGIIKPPQKLLTDLKQGLPIYDEAHPMPVQLPRLCWDWFLNQLRQHFVKTQEPPWLQPPLRARPIDAYSAQGGTIIVAATNNVSVIQGPITVPAGEIAIILRIGQAAGTPAQFDTLVWRIVRGALGRLVPVSPFYAAIGLQLGLMTSPSVLGAPIIVRGGQQFDFQASNPGGVDLTAFGRLQGWLFPVQMFTDGSFREMIVD